MKKLILYALLLFSASIVNAQKTSRYLVFTFEKKWKVNRNFCDGGNYLWIIPFDSCSNKLSSFKDSLKPLFVAEYQVAELLDSMVNKRSLGIYPIDEKDYKEPVLKILRQNRRLVQKIKTDYTCPKDQMTVFVYVTPITATCQIQKFGLKQNDVCYFNTNPLTWQEFWNLPQRELQRITYCDFSDFGFVVSAQ